MNQCKGCAECTIFEGKIVTIGGCERNFLKVVETYDYHEKKWAFLPDMIYARCGFGAVGMESKLFAIGGANMYYNSELNGEIFDSYSRKFTIIKEMQNIFGDQSFLFEVKLFINGYNVIICSLTSDCHLKQFVLYDVINDKWEEKSTELL